ncbi:uncharacterized protein LOC121106109 isoform X1 [Ursus maritimus]|uniref:RING-type E3 ubiquitin transferase n=3 Tax=Ursus TaxID=9639 RepID=A0A8M1GZG1_URSMA|nr:uncharacterized protein LOC121106109 isoform X1 [Ursus maritimus]
MCSDPACGRRGSRTVGTLCVASAWRGGGTSPRLSGSSASCPTVATPTAWAACARGGRTPRTSHQVSVRRSREGSPSERSGLVTILPPHHPHRACPQCRVHSSYIIPHKFWVSKGAEKEQLIRNFKARTSQIRCRFFMQGNGRCPFKSDCIYLHQQPDKALTSDPPWTESAGPSRVSRAHRTGERSVLHELCLGHDLLGFRTLTGSRYFLPGPSVTRINMWGIELRGRDC